MIPTSSKLLSIVEGLPLKPSTPGQSLGDGPNPGQSLGDGPQPTPIANPAAAGGVRVGFEEQGYEDFILSDDGDNIQLIGFQDVPSFLNAAEDTCAIWDFDAGTLRVMTPEEFEECGGDPDLSETETQIYAYAFHYGDGDGDGDDM